MRLVITLYEKEEQALKKLQAQANEERSKVSYAEIIREAIRLMAKDLRDAA